MKTRNLFLLILAALLTITSFNCQEDTIINTTQKVFYPHFLCWGENDSTIFIYYDSFNSNKIKLMGCNINAGQVSTVPLSEVEQNSEYISKSIRGLFSKIDSSIIFNLNGKLYKQNINGGQPSEFFSYGNSFIRLLSISEDCTKFIFLSTYEGNFDIFIMDYNGINLRNLTNDTNFEFLGGEISTIAGKVIYLREDGIFSVNLDGSNKTNLSNYPPKYTERHWAPSYSLDKSKMLYIRHIRNGDRILAMMNLDGSNKTNVTDTSNKVQSYFVTNDNNRIVFYDLKYPDDYKELHINPHSINSVNFCNGKPQIISHFSNAVIFQIYNGNYYGDLYLCRNYSESILIASSIY